MAFQTIPGGLIIPSKGSDENPSFQDLLIDAASEKAASIVRAGKTGTIDKVGFKTRTVTTGDTVDVRLETVDLATGNPSGTLLGTNSNGSQVIGDADDNTWFTTALTTGVAVTKGDLFAVVIVNGSVPGNMNIAAFNWNRSLFPYALLFTTVWTRPGTNRGSNFSFEYDDGSYTVSPGVMAVLSNATVAFSSASR